MCTDHLPDPNNRAYYPNMEDKCNHINKAKKAMQYSIIVSGKYSKNDGTVGQKFFI